MHTKDFSNLRGDIMKVVKCLTLLAMGAAAAVIYQRYSADMIQMVTEFIDDKYKCQCDELEN